MPQQQHSRQAHLDWEFFLTGLLVNDPLPRFSPLRRGYALWKTGNVLFLMRCAHLLASLFESLRRPRQAELVRQQEWKRLRQNLSQMESSLSNTDAQCSFRLARRELVFCQMLVRVLFPTGACLVRSLACCTYLRALGFPATVVIGKARFDLSSQYSFHAWTELAGQVVNDHAELQSGYIILQRIPY